MSKFGKYEIQKFILLGIPSRVIIYREFYAGLDLFGTFYGNGKKYETRFSYEINLVFIAYIFSFCSLLFIFFGLKPKKILERKSILTSIKFWVQPKIRSSTNYLIFIILLVATEEIEIVRT